MHLPEAEIDEDDGWVENKKPKLASNNSGSKKSSSSSSSSSSSTKMPPPPPPPKKLPDIVKSEDGAFLFSSYAYEENDKTAAHTHDATVPARAYSSSSSSSSSSSFVTARELNNSASSSSDLAPPLVSPPTAPALSAEQMAKIAENRAAAKAKQEARARELGHQ
jgi:hypothetical protein